MLPERNTAIFAEAARMRSSAPQSDRGADNDRRAVLLAVIEQALGRSGVGEVDDYIAFAGKLKRIGKNREICILHRIDIKSRNDLHTFSAADNVVDDMAHAAAAAGKCNFQHLFIAPLDLAAGVFQLALDVRDVLLARLNQRQAQTADLPTEQLHSLLDRDRVDFAEQCIDQIVILQLQLSSLRIPVVEAQLRNVCVQPAVLRWTAPR